MLFRQVLLTIRGFTLLAAFDPVNWQWWQPGMTSQETFAGLNAGIRVRRPGLPGRNQATLARADQIHASHAF